MNPVRRALRERHEYLIGAAREHAQEDWEDQVSSAAKQLADAGGEGEAEIRAFFIFFMIFIVGGALLSFFFF